VHTDTYTHIYTSMCVYIYTRIYKSGALVGSSEGGTAVYCVARVKLILTETSSQVRRWRFRDIRRKFNRNSHMA